MYLDTHIYARLQKNLDVSYSQNILHRDMAALRPSRIRTLFSADITHYVQLYAQIEKSTKRLGNGLRVIRMIRRTYCSRYTKMPEKYQGI